MPFEAFLSLLSTICYIPATLGHVYKWLPHFPLISHFTACLNLPNGPQSTMVTCPIRVRFLKFPFVRLIKIVGQLRYPTEFFLTSQKKTSKMDVVHNGHMEFVGQFFGSRCRGSKCPLLVLGSKSRGSKMSWIHLSRIQMSGSRCLDPNVWFPVSGNPFSRSKAQKILWSKVIQSASFIDDETFLLLLAALFNLIRSR